jgi:hypothetical protein
LLQFVSETDALPAAAAVHEASHHTDAAHQQEELELTPTDPGGDDNDTALTFDRSSNAPSVSIPAKHHSKHDDGDTNKHRIKPVDDDATDDNDGSHDSANDNDDSAHSSDAADASAQPLYRGNFDFDAFGQPRGDVNNVNDDDDDDKAFEDDDAADEGTAAEHEEQVEQAAEEVKSDRPDANAVDATSAAQDARQQHRLMREQRLMAKQQHLLAQQMRHASRPARVNAHAAITRHHYHVETDADVSTPDLTATVKTSEYSTTRDQAAEHDDDDDVDEAETASHTRAHEQRVRPMRHAVVKTHGGVFF